MIHASKTWCSASSARKINSHVTEILWIVLVGVHLVASLSFNFQLQ